MASKRPMTWFVGLSTVVFLLWAAFWGKVW